jgi:uncharacterized protein
MFPVKILVDRLTETPSAQRFSVTPSWVAERFGADPGHRLEGLGEDVVFELRAHRIGPDVYLEGEVTGALDLACSRCLTRYRGPIRERFRLVLEPAGDRVPADPEGAAALAHEGLYLADELESGWFRGTEIQLDRFVGELLALAVPVQPLCREDCRGLCPRCGVDRNVESCSCSEARPDSPFAVLAALRSPDREGSPPGTSSEASSRAARRSRAKPKK